MAIGDLDEAALAELTSRVRQRIVAASVSMSPASDLAAMELAGAAVQFIVQVAPRTPVNIGREAAIRLGGWLMDNRPAVVEHVIRDPSGTDITLKFANSAATASGFRHSGASALVARFIQRRAGVVG